MIKGLLDKITSQGDRGAIVPFSRINDIKNDMTSLKNGGFHTDWLNRMAKHMTDDANKFIPPDTEFEPHSLISVLMPSPKVIIQFVHSGKILNGVIPPHYTDWYFHNDRALQYIRDYLAPFEFSAVTAMTVTQKLLAVHCGLAKYGRNNICYNDEFGSYMQIMTYISDIPCDETAWFPISRMESCDNCRACCTSCPTGAIDEARQLVDTDKCITYFDELPGDVFPEWMDKGVHNSIVGCIKCQDCCPANKKNADNIKYGVSFTEAETTELLQHKGDNPYSSSLAQKIEASGIPPEYAKPDVLPRNLVVLLSNVSE